MRLTGLIALACCLLVAGCVSDDDGRDDGRDADGGPRSQPEVDLDASMDAGGSSPGDGGSAGSNPYDGGGDAAVPGPDASRAACVIELECAHDCVYEPRELDPDEDCPAESGYVYEGTCGAYRYRATGDGYGGGASYYRLDTGELVATQDYSDTPDLCDGREVWETIAGDAAVVAACEIPFFSAENLCCFTERGYYIAFCDLADAGP